MSGEDKNLLKAITSLFVGKYTLCSHRSSTPNIHYRQADKFWQVVETPYL